ncbi:MAG: DUF4352 domain-containing protein [Actinomycetota bacterium]|nr:DUF4352 domain-containing protein [Actinomycetota bacterium]
MRTLSPLRRRFAAGLFTAAVMGGASGCVSVPDAEVPEAAASTTPGEADATATGGPDDQRSGDDDGPQDDIATAEETSRETAESTTGDGDESQDGESDDGDAEDGGSDDSDADDSDSDDGDSDDAASHGDESVAVGTQQDPIPIGERATLQDWEITVNEVNPDAEDIVLREEYNEPAAEGRQFVLYTYTVTNTSDEPVSVWIDLWVGLVDDGGETLGLDGDGSCGLIPGDWLLQDELAAGETSTGSGCMAVPSEAMDSMLLEAEDWIAFSDEKLYFAID